MVTSSITQFRQWMSTLKGCFRSTHTGFSIETFASLFCSFIHLQKSKGLLEMRGKTKQRQYSRVCLLCHLWPEPMLLQGSCLGIALEAMDPPLSLLMEGNRNNGNPIGIHEVRCKPVQHRVDHKRCSKKDSLSS